MSTPTQENPTKQQYVAHNPVMLLVVLAIMAFPIPPLLARILAPMQGSYLQLCALYHLPFHIAA